MRRCFILVIALLMVNFAPAAEPPDGAPGVATAQTPVLRDWEKLHYGMFIHYGLSTFVGDQFGRFEHPSTAYAPTDLDVEQWAQTAEAAGMKYMVLTVKHHYGHALWPSACSDYTVATSGDKTDVVKAFVEACRRHDLKPGFYYSLGWDRVHQQSRTPAEYEQFVHDQLRELLTGYGPITELWFDIAWDVGPDMAGVLQRLYAHCKSLQPDCLVLLNQSFVDGSTIAEYKPSYIGKVLSETPVPIWPKDLNNGERTVPRPMGHNPWISFKDHLYYIPDEVCDTVGQQRWFWGPNDDIRSARQLVELYRWSVGRKANLLLNAWPDKTGRIPAETVQRLVEVAELIQHPERVQSSLLVGRPVMASNVYHGDYGRWGPQRAVDMDITPEAGTRWATGDEVRSAWLEVDLGGPQRFARATLSEYNDSIRAFELQVPDDDGGWRTIYQGTTIGGPGVDVTFPPVTARRVRLVITEATLGPTIWDFALYPPR
ncbi:MAG: alpha-L-fucosidase [Phycisphaerae bacterium]|jgi:alpha-L-fucosidase